VQTFFLFYSSCPDFNVTSCIQILCFADFLQTYAYIKQRKCVSLLCSSATNGGPSPLSPRSKEQRWQCYGRLILRLLGRSSGGLLGEAAGPQPADALPGEAGGMSAAALLGEAVVATARDTDSDYAYGQQKYVRKTTQYIPAAFLTFFTNTLNTFAQSGWQ
jgi:hypothetical protein